MANFILVPRASVSVEQFFNDILRRVALGTRMGELSEADIHCCSLTKALSSMPLGAIAVVSDIPLLEMYVMRVLFLFFVINPQSKARRVLYFALLIANPSSNQSRIL